MIIKIFLSIFSLLFLVSCATPEVLVRKDSTFTKKDMIIVRSEHGDRLSLQPIIEETLIEHGYRVVSTKEENPKYIFRYRYACLPGNIFEPHGPCKFSASLLPIEGDKPDAVIHYKDPSPWTLRGFIKEIIESLDQKLARR